MFSMRRAEDAFKHIPKTWLGEREREREGQPGATSETSETREKTLPLRFGDLDEMLPGKGLPRGAVVELATPSGLACATSIALAACASAQAEAKLRGGEQAAGAWCAWSSPFRISRARQACSRLLWRVGGWTSHASLLSCPPQARFPAWPCAWLRAGSSRSLVVDLVGIPGRERGRRPPDKGTRNRWVTPVRRLAIAIGGLETTVILLTDLQAKRSLPLPTAMRLEIERAVESADCGSL